MKKKSVLAAVMLLLVVTCAGIGYTSAYLISDDAEKNVFDVSEIDIDIPEIFIPPEETEPGTVITKKPCIRNNSDTDCYVRAGIEFTDGGDEICQPLQINDGWVKKHDGYYYWRGKISPGGQTGYLFDSVTIRNDISAEDIVPFDVLVYAEAVQAGDLTQEEAWADMK